MKNLIIIGANGFARDIYSLALSSIGFNSEFIVGGFIDDNMDYLNKEYQKINSSFSDYPSIISTIKDYIVRENDVFICAIGDTSQKKICIELISKNGGKFINLIHSSAHIDKTAILGLGVIVLNNSFIGAGSKIGNHVLIQVSTVVGHDCKIGDLCRIDCNAVCVGGIELEDDVVVHTSAIINHNVKVFKGACIGAGSFVIRSVKGNTTVFGSPARQLS
jgi:sugar O-acyltransferase (sialic acid O-acetyltransferase NeuD family)